MGATAKNAASIQSWCISYVAKILDTPAERVDPEVEVDRLGLDSATAVALIMSLEEWLEIELMPEMLFEYPTIAGLSKHLESLLPKTAESRSAR